MKVVITEDQLRAAKACDAYLKSPEWDSDRRALVYADIDQTIQRLSAHVSGRVHLHFLVDKKLIPLTKAPCVCAPGR
jgi:hypothetical protein